MDKINSEKNRNIFKEFNDMLKNKRKDILEECFYNKKSCKNPRCFEDQNN